MTSILVSACLPEPWLGVALRAALVPLLTLAANALARFSEFLEADPFQDHERQSGNLVDFLVDPLGSAVVIFPIGESAERLNERRRKIVWRARKSIESGRCGIAVLLALWFQSIICLVPWIQKLRSL